MQDQKHSVVVIELSVRCLNTGPEERLTYVYVAAVRLESHASLVEWLL